MPDTLAACQGDSIALPAVGVNIAKYTWTAPDGAIYAGANPMVFILEGFYTLEVENPQGCTIRDTLHIAIRQRPVITALSHSCPECVGGFEECELVPSGISTRSGWHIYVFMDRPGWQRYLPG